MNEENTKKPTWRRLFAYIIDLVIVSYIAGLFASIEFINPYMEKYNETSQKYVDMISNMNENDFNTDILYEFDYDLSYYGSITSLISIAVTILYFVVFQYYNKGRTIGKAIMKIKIVNENNEKPYLMQLLLRSLIINSIVANIISNVLVIFASKEIFINSSIYIQFFNTGLLLATYGMIIIRDDRRGLHDLLGKTYVVYKEEEKINDVKEANVIEKEISKDNKTLVKGKKGKKNENSNRK